MESRKQSRIFRITIDIITGVLLTQSFFNVERVLIPIGDIFTDVHTAIDASGLALAHSIVIIGWISYHRSVREKPHQGPLGNARYAIDIIILFLVYYLISISNPQIETIVGKKVAYGETFLWVVPAMFFCYFVWDAIKHIEHKQKSMKRMLWTLLFGYISIAIGVVYYLQGLNIPVFDESSWNNKTVIDAYFITATFVSTFLYRLFKWPARSV